MRSFTAALQIEIYWVYIVILLIINISNRNLSYTTKFVITKTFQSMVNGHSAVTASRLEPNCHNQPVLLAKTKIKIIKQQFQLILLKFKKDFFIQKS
ncbi:hypothetical protein EAE89_09480 [Photorhabdus heterorhabditis]|uniref:Uncharacterized protein n=1 Tax=Photorhabdus heterorhabditis TaxID=880156 RepID=A0ABR5K8V8_9GAMM|nr:hypothetical protein AM629_16820 [Photorhabdus heterorhabditis]MBS9441929.1 hypothetical protein [Photorhabdus heterorhabditis]